MVLSPAVNQILILQGNATFSVPPSSLQPCASWNNTAQANAYGPNIASSPFYLSATPTVPRYSSTYDDLPIDVAVLDYYGQIVTGGDGPSDDVAVTAANPKVRMDR